MRRGSKVLLSLLTVATVCTSPLFGQSFEGMRPTGDRVQGYLQNTAELYRDILPAPPAVGSPEDQFDLAAINTLQATTSDERWQDARADERLLYPRFVDALGSPIDRAHSPQLVTLLNRTEQDVLAPTGAAKNIFQRPRPFQRIQLKRLCGNRPAPAPEPNPKEGSSYPSGHTAVGWMAALVLAQVAPERAPQILSRALDYGFSREICGMHFPSDVAAGRMLATAVFEHLAAEPDFQKDVACARAERAALSAGGPGASCVIPLQPTKK